MAASTSDLSPQILSDLRAARKGRPLLEAAGLPLDLWEACCLALSDRVLLHGELDRPAGPVRPEFAERVRELRGRLAPLVARLRDFIGPPPSSPEESERRELILGFIAGSPAARESAERWLADPEGRRGEAALKLQVIGNLVERYRLALESPAAAPPSGLRAVAGSGRVELSWDPVPDATGYVLKRAEGPDGPWLPLALPSESRFADSRVVSGRSYRYAVGSVSAAGESALGTPVEASLVPPPAAPSGLRAVPGDGRVSLAWNPSEHATHYRIFRAPSSSGPYALAGEPSEPWWTDAPLPNGSAVVYSVVAVGTSGESAPSAPLTALPAAPLPAPAGVDVLPRGGEVEISWKPVPGASSYSVRRAPAPGGPWSPIASPAAPPHVDAGLTDGVAYYYSVCALSAAGEGPASEPVRAVPSPGPAARRLPAPPRPVAVPGDRQVLLRWSPVREAEAHVLLRSPRGAGPPVEIARPESTMFLDAGLDNGATYVYVVRALGGAGESADSPPVEASPAGPPPRPPDPAPPAVLPPPTPAGLSARVGDARVALAWEPSPGAASYAVRRARTPGGEFVAAGSTTERSFADTGLENGATYAYVVAAANEGGEGTPSAPVLATPVAPPPAPEGLVVAVGNAQVTMTWTPAPQASLYRVERADGPAGPFAECATSAVPSCTDSGLENGRTYAYRIVALNDGGEGPASAVATAEPLAPPPPPAGLKGRHGNGQVTMSWDPSPGATHYRVKRADDRNGPWETLTTTPRTAFTDAGLENGKTYFYIVRAINGGGKSPYSARLRATPMAPPAAPSDLVATPGDGEVSLSWSAVPGAIRYLVKRGAAPEGPFAPTGRPVEPAFTERGLRNGETCHFTVSAVTAAGEGAPAAAQATPLALPGAPERLTAAPGDGRVALSWAPTPEASSYRVSRSLSPEGPYETVGTSESPGWTDANAENGTTHFYVVTAVNARGEGPGSIVIQALPAPPPPAPSGLRATPGAGRVELAWDGWPTAERFRVKRSERAGGPYSVVGNPVAPAYVDWGVRNGKRYFYVVTALAPAGESAPSAELAVVPEAPPSPDTGKIPTLEQFEAPIVGGSRLAPGVDLDRLLDLRRVEQLRTLFDGTGQKFEAWEVTALIAREGHEARRTLDTLLRLKSDGESDAFEAGALALFDRILVVRAEIGSLVRRLRAYVEMLGLPGLDAEAMEVALSFVVSADRSRARAEAWLEEPERHRAAAAAYFRKALEIAQGYLEAMKR